MPHKEKLRPRRQVNSIRYLKNEHQFLTNFSKRTKGKTSQFILWSQCYSDTKTKDITKDKQVNISYECGCKKSSISSKPNSYKRIMHLPEWVFQECKIDLTSNNQSMSLIYSISGIRNKNLMILSLGTGNAFDKIQTLMEDGMEIP